MFRSDGKRADGMSLTPWKNGRPCVWDFTCPDTLAPSPLDNSAVRAGVVASSAETAKVNKYRLIGDEHLFVPVAIETFGVFGPVALKFFQELGRRITSVNHDPKSSAYLVQRVSIAIQRGNCASVLGTCPPGQKLGGVFDDDENV